MAGSDTAIRVPHPDPAVRHLIAKTAANTRWAKEPDRSAATRAARDGRWASYERQVDPQGVLPPDERRRRARSLEMAHMARMRLARSRSRAVTGAVFATWLVGRGTVKRSIPKRPPAPVIPPPPLH